MGFAAAACCRRIISEWTGTPRKPFPFAVVGVVRFVPFVFGPHALELVKPKTTGWSGVSQMCPVILVLLVVSTYDYREEPG